MLLTEDKAVATFDDFVNAQNAFDDLCNAGFTQAEIEWRLLVREPERASADDAGPTGVWIAVAAKERAEVAQNILMRNGGSEPRGHTTIGGYGNGLPATPY